MSQSGTIAKVVRSRAACVVCTLQSQRTSPLPQLNPTNRSLVSSIRAVPLERRPTKEKAGSGIPAFSGFAVKALIVASGIRTKNQRSHRLTSRREYTCSDSARASGQPHEFMCGLTRTPERSRGIGSPRERITRQVSIWHWPTRKNMAGSAILSPLLRQ